MMRRLATLLLVIVAAGTLAGAQGGTAKPLQIYVVDTEGGKATLFVSSTGQTALLDSGNPGGRDTDRLMAAITDAGVAQIDYLITTHYHGDHVGGLQELAKRISIATFVDHGPTVEERERSRVSRRPTLNCMARPGTWWSSRAIASPSPVWTGSS